MAKKSSAHTLEYILLGLIREEPAHGYALYDQLRATPELSLIWQVKRSKLYYLLDKLQNAGYLTSFSSKDGPYPERTVYQATDLGRESFDLWLRSPVLSSRYVRLAFLSKLFFSIRSSRESALELTSQQITICQGWLSSLKDQSQDLDQGDYISSQIFLFRIGQIQAMLDWLENCRLTIPEH